MCCSVLTHLDPNLIQYNAGLLPAANDFSAHFHEPCLALLLCACLRHLQVRPANNKAKPHGAEPQTPLKDDLNQWVWRLREPRIIKRNIAYPTNSNQGFYYNLLLDHVAFRGGRDLLPDGSDYFTECIKRGVFKNTAELDVHLQAYGRYNLYQQLTLDKLRERVNMSCSDLALHALGSPNNAGAEASGQSDSNEAANEAAALQQGLEALQDRLATEGQGCVGEELGHTSGVHRWSQHAVLLL